MDVWTQRKQCVWIKILWIFVLISYFLFAVTVCIASKLKKTTKTFVIFYPSWSWTSVIMPGGSTSSYCAVKNCTRQKGIPIHPIPADRLTKRKWLNALTKPSFPPSAGICELHFTGTSFNHIFIYHPAVLCQSAIFSQSWLILIKFWSISITLDP